LPGNDETEIKIFIWQAIVNGRSIPGMAFFVSGRSNQQGIAVFLDIGERLHSFFSRLTLVL